MSDTADAVVVGAGIAGLSTGLFLRRRTSGRVVVIDSATPGCGASGHGSGIIRVHNSDPDEMLLAESGARLYRSWSETIGGPDVFSRRGVLWLVGTGDAEALTRNIRSQKALGLDAAFLSPQDVATLVPGIRVGDLGGAAYEPDGGTVIGPEVMNALAAQALGEGVELRTFETVHRLLARGGAVVGVETGSGVVDAPTVVVAAGAWTRQVLLTVGVDLPIRAIRATLGTVYAPPLLRGAPAVFDEVNDASFVPKPNGTAVVSARDSGHLTEVDPHDFDKTCDLDAAEVGRRLVVRRLPAVAQAPLAARWASVDGCTPDRRPVIGAVGACRGLYVYAGANFKGFKVGPGAAEALAALIVTGEAPAHLHAFRPERFLDGSVSERARSYSGSRWS